MSNITFVHRAAGELYHCNQEDTNILAFDVSKKALSPFRFLSPDTYKKEIEIPVPGREGYIAHSVEGIWEGLKIIGGSIDEQSFKKRPKKREGYSQGYRYGTETLGLEQARICIYIPSYTFYLDHFAPKGAIQEILHEQRKGKRVFLYDQHDNGDIRDERPLAHASILATYLNLRIFNTTIQAECEAEEILFRILDSHICIEQKIEQIEPLLNDSEIKKAFLYRCLEHPQNSNDYHIAQAIGRE